MRVITIWNDCGVKGGEKARRWGGQERIGDKGFHDVYEETITMCWEFLTWLIGDRELNGRRNFLRHRIDSKSIKQKNRIKSRKVLSNLTSALLETSIQTWNH